MGKDTASLAVGPKANSQSLIDIAVAIAAVAAHIDARSFFQVTAPSRVDIPSIPISMCCLVLAAPV